MSERRIQLSTIGNCRDLGGLIGAEGRTIRSGIFLRSAKLWNADETDVQLLKDRRLRAVIDLRSADEREEKPDRLMAGVLYYAMPVFDGMAAGVTHDRQSEHEKYLADLPVMTDFYRMMIEDREMRTAIAGILKKIMAFDETEGSILWHCSEGKDRCGVISALVLKLLGVSDEDIMMDYLITNETNQKKSEHAYAKAKEAGLEEPVAEKVRDMMLAKQEYLEAAKEAVRKNFGSAENFFHEGLGITEEEILTFRERFLEDR